MTTYYIVAAGTAGTLDAGNTNGYPQIAAGSVITAQPGDVFIVDGAFNANTVIQTSGAGPCDVEVRFEQNITGLPAVNQGAITFSSNVVATVNIADGVDADSVQLHATLSDGITVNAGDGSRVGQIIGSRETDTVVGGDNVTFNGLVFADSSVANVTAGTNATFNVQVTMNADNSVMSLTTGTDATFNASIVMPGVYTDKTLILGDDATVNGSIVMTSVGTAVDRNDLSMTAGNNLVVTGSFVAPSSYSDNAITMGANTSIGGAIDMGSSYSTTVFIIGPDSDVGTSIILDGAYNDNDLSL